MESVSIDNIKTSHEPFFSRANSFSSVLNKAVITTQFHETLSLEHGLHQMLQLLKSCKQKNGTVYIIGNGGSAAVASHASIDFINMAKMKALALLDSAVTTCISNDYGYEQIYARQLEIFVEPDDVLISISSSGNSKNMLQAISTCVKKNVQIITLSGFSNQNHLRQLGQYNLWLDSKNYGQVEIGHAFVLHYLTDCLGEVI